MEIKTSVKPAIEAVPLKNNKAFLFREFVYEPLNVEYHQHDEIEITLIESGRGKRIIGSDLQSFREGDLVLIGSGIPHLYRGDELSDGSFSGASSLVVQIRSDFFNSSFFNYDEISSLGKLKDHSKKAVSFSNETSKKVAPLIRKLAVAKGYRSLLILMEILGILADSEEFNQTVREPQVKFSQSDSERGKKVFKYILDNYEKEISLNEAASLVGLSKPAFCSYFKKYSRKRFTEFTNDLRIEKACNLLAESDQRVSKICYAVGFNNLSYFNREFFRVMKCTPSVYRRKIVRTGFESKK
jgi:AraC-like DNA-binding protein